MLVYLGEIIHVGFQKFCNEMWVAKSVPVETLHTRDMLESSRGISLNLRDVEDVCKIVLGIKNLSFCNGSKIHDWWYLFNCCDVFTG